MNARPTYRGSRQAGYTLFELMVASTLASIFAMALCTCGSIYFKLFDELRADTDERVAVNVVRARMIADMKNASDAACSDSETLLLTVSTGGLPGQVEYTVGGGKLLRWYSAPDHTVPIAERVRGLTCTGLGEQGLEVELAMGAAAAPSHLYLHLAEKPPEAGGGT